MKTRILPAILTATMLLTVVSGCSEANTTISISDTLSIAERYLSEMKYEQAIIEFDKILSVEPKNEEAYIGKAEAYIELNKYDDAVDALNKCLDSAENINYDRIVEISIRIIGLAPDSAAAYLVCSNAYINLENVEKALEILQKGYSLTNNEQLKTMLEQLESGDINIEAVGEQSDAVNDDPEETQPVSESAVENLKEYLNKGEPIDKELASKIKIISIDNKENRIMISTEEQLPEFFWYAPTDRGWKVKIERDLNDLSFLSVFTNLEFLYISDFDYGTDNEYHINSKLLDDLTPLSNLKHLELLRISGPVYDLSPLFSINSLKFLGICTMSSNLQALSTLTGLKKLDISFGHWAFNEENVMPTPDFSPISRLKGLEELDIGNDTENEDLLGDLSQLSSLSELKDIFIVDTPSNHTDISFLASCPNLESITIQGKINDISPITALGKLRYIYLVNHGFDLDVTKLSELTTCEYFTVMGGYCTDLSGFSDMKNLEDLWITVQDTTDLTPLYSLNRLGRLHITYSPSDVFNRSDGDEKFKKAVEDLKKQLPDCSIN